MYNNHFFLYYSPTASPNPVGQGEGRPMFHRSEPTEREDRPLKIWGKLEPTSPGANLPFPGWTFCSLSELFVQRNLHLFSLSFVFFLSWLDNYLKIQNPVRQISRCPTLYQFGHRVGGTLRVISSLISKCMSRSHFYYRESILFGG